MSRVRLTSSFVEKYRNWQKIVRQNNGLWGTFLQLFRTDELKFGDLIGVDEHGNKYYQNKMYFLGRSRWVYYSDEKFGWDYDASQIPPDWHRWLHYMTDDPPTMTDLPRRKWMVPHTENLTATDQQYVPYSTTRPKIEAWKPPQAQP